MRERLRLGNRPFGDELARDWADSTRDARLPVARAAAGVGECNNLDARFRFVIEHDVRKPHEDYSPDSRALPKRITRRMTGYLLEGRLDVAIKFVNGGRVGMIAVMGESLADFLVRFRMKIRPLQDRPRILSQCFRASA
jgi:hypothetical protein